MRELYQPVGILAQVGRRIAINPALSPEERDKLNNVADQLIKEVKSTEGVALLSTLDEALAAPRADYEARQEALRVIRRLRDFATYEDLATLEALSVPTARLRRADVANRMRQVVRYLKERWSGGAEEGTSNAHEP